MKATEARLAAVMHPKIVHCDPQGKQMIPAETIEKIRVDLFLAILELEDKVK